MKQLFFLNQISITGVTAVGTSSAVSALQKLLPRNLYRFISAGGVMREKASVLQMTIEEFINHCANNPQLEIDRELDTLVNCFGLLDYGVLESRLGHITWPLSFKVRLICPTYIRATRRAQQLYSGQMISLILYSIQMSIHQIKLQNSSCTITVNGGLI